MNGPWVVEDDQRPWTANAERQWHHQTRARRVRETRERWYWLAKEAKIPPLTRVRVDATPLLTNRSSMPDVAACYPYVKAAVDGLVDAGVLPDDDPTHLTTLAFHTPEVGGKSGMRLVVHAEPDADSPPVLRLVEIPELRDGRANHPVNSGRPPCDRIDTPIEGEPDGV